MSEFGLALTYLLIASPFLALVLFVLWRARRLVPHRLALVVDSIWEHPALIKLFAYASGLIVAILSAYSLARFTGLLPSPETWAEGHGPWRYGLEGILVSSSIFVLALSVPGALIAGLTLAVLKREVDFFTRGLVLAGIMVAYTYVCLQVLFWTID